jgi:hypothetical protein
VFFRAFLVFLHSFLRFHFVFQKTVLFRTLRNSNIIGATANSVNESIHLLRSFSLASYSGNLSKIKQNHYKCGENLT